MHEHEHQHDTSGALGSPDAPADPAEFWDGLYAERPQVFSGNVNAALAREVGDAPPGARAVDLGCGEGADAIWLAERGWEVTAVDVSQVALDRAARTADAAGVGDRIRWEQRDLTESFPAGPFDLVSAHFLQAPFALDRERILRAAAAAVAPGGVLLVVTHAEPPPWAQGHHDHEAMPKPDDIERDLALARGEWTVEVSEIVERPATGPDGEEAVLRDSVVKARREVS
jgi:SAM-dependent methyltransferase